jgi:hypothetical protein
MQRLFDAGYEKGLREAENRGRHIDFLDIEQLPEPHRMARWYRQNSDRLSEREAEFVNQMASRTTWREPTERQEKWLRSIFLRLGGRV